MAHYEMEREAQLRNLARFQAAAAGHWTWPFDTALYQNRARELSQAERDELSVLVGHFEARHRRLSSQMIIAAVNEETPLTRLIAPLCDLLDIAGAYATNRFMALRVLLQEVHRRQQTYWGWSCEDWIALLCPDSRLFMLRHHATSGVRPYLIVASYLLADCADFRPLSHVKPVSLANAIFGKESVQASVQHVAKVIQQWGKQPSTHFPQLIARILLANHSPRLQDVRREMLLGLYTSGIAHNYQSEFARVSHVLAHLGIIEEPIARPSSQLPRQRHRRKSPVSSQPLCVPSDWVSLCQRWREDENTTLTPGTRRTYYHYLLKIGRWLHQAHPHAGDLSQWTPSLAEGCVKMINNMRVGEWTKPERQHRWAKHQGRLLARETRDHYLLVLSIFFQDCAQRGWVTLHFDPKQHFLTPSQASYDNVRGNVSSKA